MPLEVTPIPPPPKMEVTVNRRSGTPAEAAARPAAAAAAKAAAESANLLEEWVDGDPINSGVEPQQQAGGNGRWVLCLVSTLDSRAYASPMVSITYVFVAVH